jgi:hypothetical protein
LVNSGAGPRSGRAALIGISSRFSLSGSGVAIIPQAANPRRSIPSSHNRFIINFLDELMIQNLPYEKITKG